MNSPPPSNPITLYIDTDACLVRQKLYRVAERHAAKGVFLVTTGHSHSQNGVVSPAYAGAPC